jgi:L-alanine-DL-glutamate epimerase-like enolase superfamily enzyme
LVQAYAREGIMSESGANQPANPSGGLSAPVTHVRVRLVSMPVRPTLTTHSGFVVESVETVVIEIRDADGAFGWSFLWCWGAAQAALLIDALRYYASAVTGSRPDELVATCERMRRMMGFVGLRGATTFAYSGYEMAIVDLTCRRLGVSLASLNGRGQDHMPIFRTAAVLPDMSVDTAVAAGAAVIEEGFTALKLSIGAHDVAEDVARLAALRSSLPADTKIMLDAGGAYDWVSALHVAEKFAPYDPYWFEDPVPHHDYAGLARVLAKSSIPVAWGENEYWPEGIASVAGHDLAYLILDLQRLGGIRAWQKACAIAESQSVTIMSHVNPHVSVQLMASVAQRERWLEHVPWWDALAIEKIEVENGHAVLPATVGAGFTPDQEAVEKFAAGPWLELSG